MKSRIIATIIEVVGMVSKKYTCDRTRCKFMGRCSRGIRIAQVSGNSKMVILWRGTEGKLVRGEVFRRVTR